MPFHRAVIVLVVAMPTARLCGYALIRAIQFRPAGTPLFSRAATGAQADSCPSAALPSLSMPGHAAALVLWPADGGDESARQGRWLLLPFIALDAARYLRLPTCARFPYYRLRRLSGAGDGAARWLGGWQTAALAIAFVRANGSPMAPCAVAPRAASSGPASEPRLSEVALTRRSSAAACCLSPEQGVADGVRPAARRCPDGRGLKCTKRSPMSAPFGGFVCHRPRPGRRDFLAAERGAAAMVGAAVRFKSARRRDCGAGWRYLPSPRARTVPSRERLGVRRDRQATGAPRFRVALMEVRG